jgi:Flp pilus assembly protein protease CpaA
MINLCHVIIWAPIAVALLDAVWTDVHQGIIPHRSPLLIIIWCCIMQYTEKKDIFFLSPLLITLFLIILYTLFLRRYNKSMLGGGDIKLIMACALLIQPAHIGLWITFMGIGSLMTHACTPLRHVPMAPAIATSCVLCQFLS